MKILIKTILAGNLLCIYNRICQWYDTERLVLTPRRTEEEEEKEEQTDVDIDCAKKKQRNMRQARGDSLLKLIANRETLIHRGSEQAECARTVELGQLCVNNESVMDENSSPPLCREHSGSHNFRT